MILQVLLMQKLKVFTKENSNKIGLLIIIENLLIKFLIVLTNIMEK